MEKDHKLIGTLLIGLVFLLTYFVTFIASMFENVNLMLTIGIGGIGIGLIMAVIFMTIEFVADCIKYFKRR